MEFALELSANAIIEYFKKLQREKKEKLRLEKIRDRFNSTVLKSMVNILYKREGLQAIFNAHILCLSYASFRCLPQTGTFWEEHIDVLKEQYDTYYTMCNETLKAFREKNAAVLQELWGFDEEGMNHYTKDRNLIQLLEKRDIGAGGVYSDWKEVFSKRSQRKKVGMLRKKWQELPIEVRRKVQEEVERGVIWNKIQLIRDKAVAVSQFLNDPNPVLILIRKLTEYENFGIEAINEFCLSKIGEHIKTQKVFDYWATLCNLLDIEL